MIRKVIVYILLSISAFVLFFPILFALLASLLSTAELYSGHYIPSRFSLDSYLQAFGTIPLFKFLVNSFIVSSIVTLGQLLLCSLAAYAIVFIPFKGRNFFFFLFISTLLIPWEAAMIPNFVTILNLGWLNTYLALTVPFLTTAFGIFLLRQHFMTLPKELYESAQIDGCSRFRFYWSFALPLSKPMLSALAIYAFLTTWNMYLWPLLVTSNENVRTVQIGIRMMISQEASTAWNMVMAGVVIILLPTLLLLFLGIKHIRRGLMSGALKG
ncbi:sn-glycerol 3-phosphate transport system permease protein [Caldalkalibacillus uzonensis]|uniref:Sn-glycerol 3-phosphate transport system permease protein n=1 Tax=Caldalkalibacillus uzonensis TaxID=353224 RepID=A0ABU0CNF8_9BACI|nr:carbohydrate ABC transporter permease [Caldalkalibacillus uzonensis]MDQ0337948.1 sn-glycerol 3-phosphate transport system permease protein [Caldalkalibacillus uzonensis]